MGEGTRIRGEVIELDQNKIKEFFANRENKPLPHRYNYVNYQDDHPRRALERDVIEKKRVSRFFRVNPHDNVLDIGCGVGRWGDYIVPILKDGRYVGVDYTDSFVRIATAHFGENDKTRFFCGSFQDIEHCLSENNESGQYSKILINGVLMYINDRDIEACLRSVRNLLADGGMVYIKETVGVNERLTLKDFYSNELKTDYNVIYRSLVDYSGLIAEHFLHKGYALISCGPTWDDTIDFDKETSNWFWILRRKDAWV